MNGGEIAEFAVLDQAGVDGYAGLKHRLFETGIAQVRAGVVEQSLEEADAAMAERDQVLSQLIGGALLVDAHRRHVPALVQRRDAHEGHAGLFEHHLQDGIVGQGRGQHRTVQAQPAQQGACAPLEIGTAVVELLDHQVIAEIAAAAEQAHLDVAGIEAAGIAVELGDHPRAFLGLAAHAACRFIGFEAQLGHGLAHAGARLGADVALVVDDARHGLDRDAGALGDVDYGRLALHRAAHAVGDRASGAPPRPTACLSVKPVL